MIKFGTGGWRAIIGEDFIKENVICLAQGLSDLIIEEKVDKFGIVIGFDRRFLSDKAACWIAEVLAGIILMYILLSNMFLHRWLCML